MTQVRIPMSGHKGPKVNDKMGGTSTKKGGARVGKPAGSRLAYDAIKHNKPSIKSTHKSRPAKGNWAHKVLV